MSADFIKIVSELHNQRYLMQINNLITRKVPCGIFYGINSNLYNAVNTVEMLKRAGINLTCLCIIDYSQAPNDEWKNAVSVPIVTLSELPNVNAKPSVIFNFSYHSDYAFEDYFNRMGMYTITLQDTGAAEQDYNLFVQHLSDLYSVHEIFADEESKAVFRASIKGKVTKSVRDFRYAPEPQYFLAGFTPVEGDIAIDGGAYDGATARDFVMQGAKVYAFEMDKDNYKNCLGNAEKYRFVIENIGLSDRESDAFYTQGGVGSRRVMQGGVIGHFIDLDTYVLKKDLPRVDYIKLDIEGAELDMLHGAAKTISRWKPKMAISAYHKPEDLWTLAKYIKSIRPDYEFKFRHYKVDCTDMVFNDNFREVLVKFGLSFFVPGVWEMVLYCR